ncbi:MAG: hypothetical protein HN826_12820, partial [Methylococcales bacterium]|nr:hypothetical protein [Methylococcales bacterium]
NENQQKWKKLVLIGDSILYGLFLILFLSITIKLDYWTGFSFNPPWLADFMASPIKYYFTAGFFTVLMISSHFFVRNLTANMVAKKLKTMTINSFFRGNLSAAFLKNTKPWRSIFASTPAGWGRGSKKKIQAVLGNIDGFVQTLNDNFTNPSGTTKTPTTEQQENTNPTTEEMTETETLAEK